MIEADFRREYQIDLLTELDSLSWRTFLMLVSGLSPNSAIAAKMYNRKHGDNVIKDDKAGEAYMRAMLGGG